MAPVEIEQMMEIDLDDDAMTIYDPDEDDTVVLFEADEPTPPDEWAMVLHRGNSFDSVDTLVGEDPRSINGLLEAIQDIVTFSTEILSRATRRRVFLRPEPLFLLEAPPAPPAPEGPSRVEFPLMEIPLMPTHPSETKPVENLLLEAEARETGSQTPPRPSSPIDIPALGPYLQARLQAEQDLVNQEYIAIEDIATLAPANEASGAADSSALEITTGPAPANREALVEPQPRTGLRVRRRGNTAPGPNETRVFHVRRLTNVIENPPHLRVGSMPLRTSAEFQELYFNSLEERGIVRQLPYDAERDETRTDGLDEREFYRDYVLADPNDDFPLAERFDGIDPSPLTRECPDDDDKSDVRPSPTAAHEEHECFVPTHANGVAVEMQAVMDEEAQTNAREQRRARRHARRQARAQTQAQAQTQTPARPMAPPTHDAFGPLPRYEIFQRLRQPGTQHRYPDWPGFPSTSPLRTTATPFVGDDDDIEDGEWTLDSGRPLRHSI